MEIQNTPAPLGPPEPASTPEVPTRATGEVMGKDDFLQLLVTQLSNQDPLNPMDGQEFAAQLAQFSALEQMTNLNTGVSEQTGMLDLVGQTMNSTAATGLIDKTVEVQSDTVGWQGEEDVLLGYELGTAAQDVVLTVRNEVGQVVRTFELGAAGHGTHDVMWDGQDASGDTLPEGSYTFAVSAVDAQGNPLEAIPYTKGRVDRVSFSPGGVELWIGAAAVPLTGVRSVER